MKDALSPFKGKSALRLTDEEYDDLWRKSQPPGAIITLKDGCYKVSANGKWIRMKVKG